MNKIQIIIISIVGTLLVIGSGTAGYFLGEKYGNKPINKPTITIVKESPTVSKIVTPIISQQDLDNWYKTPLEITGEIKDSNVLHVIADDKFKHAEKDFILNAAIPDKKNILIFNVVSGINYKFPTTLMFGGQVLYYRMVFSVLGFGIGAAITNQTVFFNSGIIFKF